MWVQRRITLDPRHRGFHLVTNEVLDAVPELERLEVGLLHLLIQHTSASLSLGENASPAVRDDFESWSNEAVPENAAYWTHTLEGPDDMPAHIKAALFGPSLTLPVSKEKSLSAPGRGSISASTATAAAHGRSWRPPGARRAGSTASALSTPARASRRTRSLPLARPLRPSPARRSSTGAQRTRCQASPPIRPSPAWSRPAQAARWRRS